MPPPPDPTDPAHPAHLGDCLRGPLICAMSRKDRTGDAPAPRGQRDLLAADEPPPDDVPTSLATLNLRAQRRGTPEPACSDPTLILGIPPNRPACRTARGDAQGTSRASPRTFVTELYSGGRRLTAGRSTKSPVSKSRPCANCITSSGPGTLDLRGITPACSTISGRARSTGGAGARPGLVFSACRWPVCVQVVGWRRVLGVGWQLFPLRCASA
jgi:hypothetical protein